MRHSSQPMGSASSSRCACHMRGSKIMLALLPSTCAVFSSQQALAEPVQGLYHRCKQGKGIGAICSAHHTFVRSWPLAVSGKALIGLLNNCRTSTLRSTLPSLHQPHCLALGSTSPPQGCLCGGMAFPSHFGPGTALQQTLTKTPMAPGPSSSMSDKVGSPLRSSSRWTCAFTAGIDLPCADSTCQNQFVKTSCHSRILASP